MSFISKQDLDLQIFLQTLAYPKEHYIKWFENKLIDYQDNYITQYNGIHFMLDCVQPEGFMLIYNSYSFQDNKQNDFAFNIQHIVNLHDSDGIKINIGHETSIKLVAS
jgi:hypothetical protein